MIVEGGLDIHYTELATEWKIVERVTYTCARPVGSGGGKLGLLFVYGQGYKLLVPTLSTVVNGEF